MLLLKYGIKTLGIVVFALVLFYTINNAIDRHLTEGKWVPFPRLFSMMGYESWGKVTNITLISKSSDIKIKFSILVEYFNSSRFDENSDRIELLLAYPTFEPYHKAKKEHPELIEEDPIEITVRIVSHTSKLLLLAEKPSEYKREKFNLLEHNFIDLHAHPEYYAYLYYYPKEKDYPFDYMSYPSFDTNLLLACKANHICYIENLYGKYIFKYKNLKNW